MPRTFYNESVQHPIGNVIIAGAGIIGVSIALELRRRGMDVLVLDRGEPGREASSAAAGMLAASDPETALHLRPLVEASARMFPEYVAEVERVSAMKVDFRREGAISLLESSHAPKTYRKLSQAEISRLEPGLSVQDYPVFFVEEDWVDPALLIQAALCAAARLGVEVRRNVEVQAISGRTPEFEVQTSIGTMQSNAVIDCRGAWSGTPVRPRKGQSLYVQPAEKFLLSHVIRSPEVYLVPRTSGKILIGATVEDVGYDTTVDPTVIRSLHHAAARLVPELKTATVTATWAGLRPGTPDDLPLIGATATPGSFVATGHFRNGILLAPITASIVADLVMGKPASQDIARFSPLRFPEFRRDSWTS